MKQRRYAVDDMDFDEYKAAGGTMTRAEFFNAKLSGTFSDSISKRLADHLGAAPHGNSLSDRIRQELDSREA